MPANLTPQYYEAEAAYKKAKTLEEKACALEKMLAVIPKHKGTEKLQAGLKKRLAALREKKKQKSSKSTYDPFAVQKQGAGQVVLVGFPNTGKSSLISVLTKAKAKVAEFPFATAIPLAGMMPYEDIQIQLVDTPPLTRDGIPSGLTSTMREANLLLLLIDVSTGDCLEQMETTLNLLEEKNIIDQNRQNREPGSDSKENHPFLVAASKVDSPESEENLEVLRECFPALNILPISAAGQNLEILRGKIFTSLDIIRIYSKPPGKPPEMEKPFTLRRGDTVLDFASSIHKEFSAKIKSAHVWGSARFDGQAVPKDYILEDGDIVELNI